MWPKLFGKRSASLFGLILFFSTAALAQIQVGTTTSSDWAWKGITKQNGVRVEYIFYSEDAENSIEDDGVVLKLVNSNAYPIRYSFTVIFKSSDRVHEERVTGIIPPESLVTGESAGLYWQPFGKGVSVGEIGLRGLRTRRSR